MCNIFKIYYSIISCIFIAKHLRSPNTTIVSMLIGIKIKKTHKVLGPWFAILDWNLCLTNINEIFLWMQIANDINSIIRPKRI